HGGEIELRRRDLDAHCLELVAGLLEQMRGVQQRLRRDAPHIQTCAAEGLVLLDHGDLQSKLRSADRAHIAARAGADDCEVVGHRYLLKTSPRSFARSM